MRSFDDYIIIEAKGQTMILLREDAIALAKQINIELRGMGSGFDWNNMERKEDDDGSE